MSRTRSTRRLPWSASATAYLIDEGGRGRGGALIIMLLIECPYCGERPEPEFVYGGQAHIARRSAS